MATITVPQALIEAVRFRLQDYPQLNALLDSVKLLTDVDIARCIYNATMRFNATLPIISGLKMTPMHAYQDDGGVIRSCIEMLAEALGHGLIVTRLQKNEYQFQSGGVTGARESVWRSIDQTRQEREATALRMISEIKMQLNQERCYGAVSSEYAYLFAQRVGFYAQGVVLQI